jgi:hypothetical protein
MAIDVPLLPLASWTMHGIRWHQGLWVLALTASIQQQAHARHISAVDGIAACDHAAHPIDVWIIAGQSNAVGHNEPDGQAMPPGSTGMPGIMAWTATGTYACCTAQGLMQLCQQTG